MNSRQLLEAAISLHQKGNLVEAERLYAQLLAAEPANATGLRLLGLLRSRQGRGAEALDLIGRALQLEPGSAIARLNYGNALRALGRHDEALASYDHAVALAPDFADALSNRGVALCQLGREEEALADFGAVLKLKPDSAFALNNRGLALHALNQFSEAVADFQRAIELNPRDGAARTNLGRTLESLGQFAAALQSYDAVLAIKPDDAEAWLARGNVLRALRRLPESIASFDRVLTLRPDYAEAHYNRANGLGDLGHRSAALESYDKAVALKPDYVEAFNNRGSVLLELGRHAEALASYERVLVLQPAHPRALGGVAMAALHLCDWPRVAALRDAVMAQARMMPPFTLLAYGADNALQLECARSNIAERLPVLPPPLSNGNVGKRGKIRLAYLSQDFSQHPVGRQIVELIERHDRARFEVLGISTGPDDDSDSRRRLMAAFDHFHDVRGLDDGAAAGLIHRQGVDILIDLGGHTNGSRLEILGYRPCPLQVTYLGYPGTTGAGFVDYVIGDAMVAPFEHQAFFSEKIVQLPGSFFAGNSSRVCGAPPSRAEAGLPDAGLVFCAFNKSWKISQDVFAVWMRLLLAVPQSVLWLRVESPEAQDNMRAAAQGAGVDPTRLVFAGRVSAEEHLARHALADLFLDTMPYNAHATASDALWAGLPVVTCRGDGFAGLVGASLLQAAGLGELVADDLKAYEALALALARDPARLQALRQKLVDNRATHPLFDTDRLRRAIEAAFEKMVEMAARGEPPASFAVPD